MWGFHVNISRTTQLVCGRNKTCNNNKNFVAASPGSGRRVHSAAKVDCTFVITSTWVNYTNKATDKRIKITKSCNFKHTERCAPSVLAQVLARRKSGYYSKKFLSPEALKTVVELLDTGLTEPRILRNLLKQYIPANNPLTSLDRCGCIS